MLVGNYIKQLEKKKNSFPARGEISKCNWLFPTCWYVQFDQLNSSTVFHYYQLNLNISNLKTFQVLHISNRDHRKYIRM